ncbi:hypothetical protein O4H52_14920 [Sphingomonadaceae bacterium G21617-S1]|nr:hypothetical protein [Sphingomonadaceae bacterium G21617-S1]
MKVGQLDARFGQLCPRDFASALKNDQRVVDARARLDASYAAFRQTMVIRSEVFENGRVHPEALDHGRVEQFPDAFAFAFAFAPGRADRNLGPQPDMQRLLTALDA